MKMTLKGLSAAAAFWFAYINETFSPLFWVLIGLVIVDLVLNAHREGQQFYKIGSMAVSLGIPSYLATNITKGDFSELAKYIVAALCLVYLQIVIPALLEKIKSFKVSNDPKQNAVDQAAIDAIVERVAAQVQTKAQTIESAAKVPTVIQEQDGGQGGK